MEITVCAYPKINLGLYIGSKNSDGYHSLISIFQRVKNFRDVIKIKFTEGCTEQVEIFPETIPCKENTMYAAALLWMKKTGISGKVHIDIEKSIPVKAGLGGGSADAGAVLLGLNSLFDNPLTQDQLVDTARTIGSDVPFFVLDCEAAVVELTGEKCTPVKAKKLEFELKDSGFVKMSTKEAYSKLDMMLLGKELPSAEELMIIYEKPENYGKFSNDFELIYPEIEEGYHLSGSGSWMWKVKLT